MEGGSLNLVGAEDNCLTCMRAASTFPEVDLAFSESKSSLRLFICAESYDKGNQKVNKRPTIENK